MGRRPAGSSRALAPLMAAVVALSLRAPQLALAQPAAALTLSWDAPPECPSRDAVLASIRKHLERNWDPDREALQPPHARALVTRRGARYRLEIALQVPQAEMQRVLSAKSCVALAEAAAFLIALAIEPETPQPLATVPADDDASSTPPQIAPAAKNPAATQAAAPSTPDSLPAPPVAPPATVASSEPEQSPTEVATRDHSLPTPWSFGLGAALRLDFGTLPQTPGLGLRAQLEAGVAQVHAWGGLTWWPLASKRADGYPNATLKSDAWLADVIAGYDLTTAPLTITPCAVGEYGQVRLATVGISSPDRQVVVWSAAGAGLRIAYQMPVRLRALLEILGVAPFLRPRWLVRTSQRDIPVFTSAQLALRISAGIAYVFE
jgi:hypothetical protein